MKPPAHITLISAGPAPEPGMVLLSLVIDGQSVAAVASESVVLNGLARMAEAVTRVRRPLD